jgi:antitoxin (DNA-binding transcriptional repressor) of toxin-antitoxin stability system
MKTITVAEARRSLARYLRQVVAGEEIGIVTGTDIISLQKVGVPPIDPVAGAHSEERRASDWPDFPTFDGGPVDGARNHDKYLYDEQP